MKNQRPEIERLMELFKTPNFNYIKYHKLFLVFRLAWAY
jgi:hypothetical protein